MACCGCVGVCVRDANSGKQRRLTVDMLLQHLAELWHSAATPAHGTV